MLDPYTHWLVQTAKTHTGTSRKIYYSVPVLHVRAWSKKYSFQTPAINSRLVRARSFDRYGDMVYDPPYDFRHRGLTAQRARSSFVSTAHGLRDHDHPKATGRRELRYGQRPTASQRDPCQGSKPAALPLIRRDLSVQGKHLLGSLPDTLLKPMAYPRDSLRHPHFTS
ncbi:hypothetical protein M0R45_025999 [Rubus argutus]|uniref:Uncharacterized protein n=1 Tax=Rubus argutus TaxID=59490 RepID=A0AAW1WY04_RUBAR